MQITFRKCKDKNVDTRKFYLKGKFNLDKFLSKFVLFKLLKKCEKMDNILIRVWWKTVNLYFKAAINQAKQFESDCQILIQSWLILLNLTYS